MAELPQRTSEAGNPNGAVQARHPLWQEAPMRGRAAASAAPAAPRAATVSAQTSGAQDASAPAPTSSSADATSASPRPPRSSAPAARAPAARRLPQNPTPVQRSSTQSFEELQQAWQHAFPPVAGAEAFDAAHGVRESSNAPIAEPASDRSAATQFEAARLVNLPPGGDLKAILGLPASHFDPEPIDSAVDAAIPAHDFADVRETLDQARADIADRASHLSVGVKAQAAARGLPTEVVTAALKMIEAASEQATAHFNGFDQRIDAAARDHLMNVLGINPPGPGEPDVSDAQLDTALATALLRTRSDKAGAATEGSAAAAENRATIEIAWANHNQRLGGPDR